MLLILWALSNVPERSQPIRILSGSTWTIISVFEFPWIFMDFLNVLNAQVRSWMLTDVLECLWTSLNFGNVLERLHTFLTFQERLWMFLNLSYGGPLTSVNLHGCLSIFTDVFECPWSFWYLHESSLCWWTFLNHYNSITQGRFLLFVGVLEWSDKNNSGIFFVLGMWILLALNSILYNNRHNKFEINASRTQRWILKIFFLFFDACSGRWRLSG